MYIYTYIYPPPAKKKDGDGIEEEDVYREKINIYTIPPLHIHMTSIHLCHICVWDTYTTSILRRLKSTLSDTICIWPVRYVYGLCGMYMAFSSLM